MRVQNALRMDPKEARRLAPLSPLGTEPSRNPYRVLPDGTLALELRRKGGAIAGYALIEAEDLPLVAGLRWSLKDTGYVQTAYKKGRAWGNMMHRLLACPEGSGLDVDHINRDRLDNRRSNLRLVSSNDNKQNTGSQRGSASRYRNVCKAEYGWQVYVRGVYYGKFKSEEQAAKVARDVRARLMPYATG